MTSIDPATAQIIAAILLPTQIAAGFMMVCAIIGLGNGPKDPPAYV